MAVASLVKMGAQYQILNSASSVTSYNQNDLRLTRIFFVSSYIDFFSYKSF
jgi:hypothetical protein